MIMKCFPSMEIFDEGAEGVSTAFSTRVSRTWHKKLVMYLLRTSENDKVASLC